MVDSTFLVFYILSAIELYPNWEQWAMTHLPRNDREASFLEFAKTRKEPRKRSGTRKQGLLSWNTDRPIPTRVSEAQLLCRDSLRQYLLYCNKHVFIGPQEDRYLTEFAATGNDVPIQPDFIQAHCKNIRKLQEELENVRGKRIDTTNQKTNYGSQRRFNRRTSQQPSQYSQIPMSQSSPSLSQSFSYSQSSRSSRSCP